MKKKNKILNLELSLEQKYCLEGLIEREISSLERDIRGFSIKDKLESSEQIDIDFLTDLIRKIEVLK